MRKYKDLKNYKCSTSWSKDIIINIRPFTNFEKLKISKKVFCSERNKLFVIVKGRKGENIHTSIKELINIKYLDCKINFLGPIFSLETLMAFTNFRS